MIQSMTGFARRDCEHPSGIATWEIRSVNHRFLEPHFHLPDNFKALEKLVRECLQQNISRGKLDCRLYFMPSDASKTQLVINKPLAAAVYQAHQALADKFNIKNDASSSTLLAWPGMIELAAQDSQALFQPLLTLFAETITDLKQQRQQEGAQLKPILIEKIKGIQQHIPQIRQQFNQTIDKHKQQLQEKCAKLANTVESHRFEQEVLFIAQKMDITEECDRLNTHSQEVQRILAQGGVIGRRLDFLMQELHREANTIAAKSSDSQITQWTVAVKVLIEQFREQIQNIE